MGRVGRVARIVSRSALLLPLSVLDSATELGWHGCDPACMLNSLSNSGNRVSCCIAHSGAGAGCSGLVSNNKFYFKSTFYSNIGRFDPDRRQE
jgi:hypothetical protein